MRDSTPSPHHLPRDGAASDAHPKRGGAFRPSLCVLALLAVLAGTLATASGAHAAADRIRLGSAADVSRTAWSGPAFTMNGSGGVVPATMQQAIDTVRGGTGSLDVVVLAASAPGSGSQTPECDTVMTLAGVNSCTTWTLTTAEDGNDPRVNADVRNAEFVYFAGGDQCRYAAWQSTALRDSVRSVVAKGGGSGGGSAGHHINSEVVYDACRGGVTSREALRDPYHRSITFTTDMFDWPHYGGTINDSHFVARDRMGRTMAFVARAVQDGLTADGTAWGVGVEEGGSLFIDRHGHATAAGADSYVVLGDHQPERAQRGKPLTFSDYKIWRLRPGDGFDFANRPTCGYYLRSVIDGVPDPNLYHGTPVTDCSGSGGSDFTETEPNDHRGEANDATGLLSPATLTGSLHRSEDRDYYRLALTSGRTLAVACAIPDAYDADLYLLDSSGRTLTRSVNDGMGVDESLTLTRTASGTGTYYLEVAAYRGWGDDPYRCTLSGM